MQEGGGNPTQVTCWSGRTVSRGLGGMGGGGPLSLPTRPRGLGRESPVPEALEDGDEGSALVGEATEAV